MTNNEFDREFNILYDNVASKGAPGINKYEKSVFLTQSQEELVRSYYSGGPESRGFEGDEKLRREMSNLVIPYSSSLKVESTFGLDPNSKFFVIPQDTWYIINESVVISGPNNCVNGKTISVKPITHDEYNVSSKSPFRKPNSRRAWRVDVNLGTTQQTVELISQYEIQSYKMRYVTKPDPIILVNLATDPEYAGMGLTIDGETIVTSCKLNSSMHRKILNRAVEMAIMGYRENSLGNKVELNKRSV